MSNDDYKWSKTEKQVARAAFDKAYKREMTSIKKEIIHRMNHLTEDRQIWQLEDYLRNKRREMNKKYDYRYSVLMFVLARLLSEGFLTRSELAGLSEEKLAKIDLILS
jgi:hypothetical protein